MKITGRKLAGWSIIASVFGGMFVAAGLSIGWLPAMGVFGVAGGISGLIYLGVWLSSD